jgi:hypothetical protein
VLSECCSTSDLSLVPEFDFSICTASAEVLVPVGIADCCHFHMVASEHTDLGGLLHVPHVGSAANCTAEELC